MLKCVHLVIIEKAAICLKPVQFEYSYVCQCLISLKRWLYGFNVHQVIKNIVMPPKRSRLRQDKELKVDSLTLPMPLKDIL